MLVILLIQLSETNPRPRTSPRPSHCSLSLLPSLTLMLAFPTVSIIVFASPILRFQIG